MNRKEAMRLGLADYETGRPCVRGHVAARRVIDHVCVICHRLKCRNWLNQGERRAQAREQRRQRYWSDDRIAARLDRLQKIGLSRRRRSDIRRATPAWVNSDAIRAIYTRCEELNRQMQVRGIRLVVDHIVPLRGRVVCGLHVPENLRIVSETLRRRRGNRFDRRHHSIELLTWLRQRGL